MKITYSKPLDSMRVRCHSVPNPTGDSKLFTRKKIVSCNEQVEAARLLLCFVNTSLTSHRQTSWNTRGWRGCERGRHWTGSKSKEVSQVMDWPVCSPSRLFFSVCFFLGLEAARLRWPLFYCGYNISHTSIFLYISVAEGHVGWAARSWEMPFLYSIITKVEGIAAGSVQ